MHIPGRTLDSDFLPSPQTGLGDPATKRLHILAVVFSLTGAVLISDPAHAISSMGCLDFSSVREGKEHHLHLFYDFNII